MLRIIRKVINYLRYKRAKRNVFENATLIGRNHQISIDSRINLVDGAKRENVILEDNCWPEGEITVQHNGVVVMHKHSKIDHKTRILCVNRVEIGAYTAIANDTVICDNNNHPISPSYRKRMRLSPAGDDMRMWKHSASAPIIIGENCWIGTNVRICKGVTIGDNSIVAACSVVTKDVPANCIVAGNPAKVVKTGIDIE